MVNAGERSSNETSGESESALMAKHVAKKGKPKRRKRETNAERAAREFERRRMSFIAERIADVIRRRSKDQTESPAREAGMRFIGPSICDYCENVPKLLRLVADLLEGKLPLQSPGNDRYDGLIKEAYLEACNRMPPPRENQDGEGYEMDDGWLHKIIIRFPYFREFLDIFRKQNPKLQGV
jgi:hypothetical protein